MVIISYGYRGLSENIMAKIPQPLPLYPTYDELRAIRFEDYPALKSFLSDGESWWLKHWHWGEEFLNYTGRNKSAHTYTRFRNEVERFLLWTFLIKQKPIDDMRKADILEYADFCWKPPVNWISLNNHDKFVFRNGVFEANPDWLPFKLKTPKNASADVTADKRNTSPHSKR